MWHSGIMIQLVSVEAPVPSPAQRNGFRIQRCCSCGISCKSSSDSIPGLGNFHVLQKQLKKEKRKRIPYEEPRVWRSHRQYLTSDQRKRNDWVVTPHLIQALSCSGHKNNESLFRIDKTPVSQTQTSQKHLKFYQMFMVSSVIIINTTGPWDQ